MAETVTIARPPIARATVSRRRSAKPATVSAPDGSGFDVDTSRVSYLRFLRHEHRHTPRSQADAAHIEVKTEMLQLRLMEKRRELVKRDDVNELIDAICGAVLTALSSMPARCAPRGDLAIRRSIERVVFEVRTEIAKVCEEMADKSGEPPLD